jgi:AmmeMemoRadiSam system protein B/AmmeMemoRadiSam system protein A
VRDELSQVVQHYLDLASPRPSTGAPKAIIAPHAGYVYSGPVAASAYVNLADVRSAVTRVVLLGPSHRVALRGLATTSADHFLTPLGAVPIDREAVERALRLPQVAVFDAAHAQEHSLVHLPFLQQILEAFSLVPFSVGEASPEEVSEVLEALWGGPETLIVVSSDLSHYYDYETARRLDAATTRAIEALDPAALDSESACGRVPVRGLLVSARRRGLEVTTVDVRSSGDTAGARDRVVGYGSYLFTAAPGSARDDEPSSAAQADPLSAAQADPRSDAEDEPWEERCDRILLDLARRSIEQGAEARAPLPVAVDALPPPLRAIRSSFVTLKLEGQLRGCIGSLEARLPLAADVSRSAYRAAYHDPRFAPVTAHERGRLELHVSVLSPMTPIPHRSEAELLSKLRPGIDGLVLRCGSAQATYLPDVWQSLPEPEAFLRTLKQKAGLSPDHWASSVEVFRYTTRAIG